MHHVVVERWSRRESPIHRRDARAKLVAALAMIVAIATTPATHGISAAAYSVVLLVAVFVARLPLGALVWRAALVLPFTAVFALASWLSGDPLRASALVWRSYLSAFTALLLISTTPLIELLRALEWMRVPGFVILIAQFLYRYLFVISEQAQHMRVAARCRAGEGHRLTFGGAAAALSVLFLRSYARADGIQRAMLARGFSGHFPTTIPTRFTYNDACFGALAAAICMGIRFAQ